MRVQGGHRPTLYKRPAAFVPRWLSAYAEGGWGRLSTRWGDVRKDRGDGGVRRAAPQYQPVTLYTLPRMLIYRYEITKALQFHLQGFCYCGSSSCCDANRSARFFAMFAETPTCITRSWIRSEIRSFSCKSGMATLSMLSATK